MIAGDLSRAIKLFGNCVELKIMKKDNAENVEAFKILFIGAFLSLSLSVQHQQ